MKLVTRPTHSKTTYDDVQSVFIIYTRMILNCLKLIGFDSTVSVRCLIQTRLMGSQMDGFSHRPQCTVTLNSNLAILKT